METKGLIKRNLSAADSLIILSIVVLGIGVIALLGWVLNLPDLASFWTDLIPMAPDTAFLLIVYGLAVCVRVWAPLKCRSVWVIAACGVGAILMLFMFVLSCTRVYWAGEHFWVNIIGTVKGVPVGHMSPVSALCFALASLSFVLSLSPSAIRSRRAVLALGCAGLILGVCLIFILAYLFGTPFLYEGKIVPPALNTLIAFLMLGLALLILVWHPPGFVRRQTPDVSEPSTILFLTFILMATGIVTIGYLSYQQFVRNYRVEVERQLSTIADLKLNLLKQWRLERLGDGAILFRNAAFSSMIRRFIERPEDAESMGQLQGWIGKYVEEFQYDQVCLVDTQGIRRLVVPANRTALSSALLKQIPSAMQSGKVSLCDFYRNEIDKRIYLAIIVPILEKAAPAPPLGVIILQIDPEIYLYPFIKYWPTASTTAETLLVRREGSEAVFLNNLRFKNNTALNLRAPLNRVSMPAARAILGQEGIMEGSDYRGEPVVAATRTIPDSPWSMVARMDKAEVYAPVRARLFQIIIMMCVLLFGAGACVGMVWRRQSLHFCREQAAGADALKRNSLELQNKNAELERFLYTASHDLKSPVVTVRTFLGFLEKDLADGDAGRIEKDLRFIRTATEKMGQLLDDLLEMSRIGRVVTPPVRIAFREVVEESLGAVAGRISERGVTIKVEDQGVMLYGDRIRLAEIWQNLVENAVKFMGDQKAPQIHIGVDTHNLEAIFYVRDNGIGIDPRHQAKVFELFEKLNPGVEGTGIGLALVKRIVELYKGRIWVESAGVGQGTCFYFTLSEAIVNIKIGGRG